MKQFTDRIKKRIMSDEIFRCSIIAVLLLLFAYLIKAVGWKEFWYDEVATIGYVRNGLSLWDVLHYYQTIEVTNLPLYAVIEYFFYHFFPPEDIWLLLPGILMTLAGVALLVRLADKVGGRRMAYVVLLMSVLSTTVINRMALELRAYALLFLASVLVLSCLYQYKDKFSTGGLITTSVAMIILAYSHYFGILFLAVLGIGVLVDIIKNKKGWKRFLPFLIAAGAFLPWFYMAMKNSRINTGEFWIAPPGIKELLETVGYLLGGNYLLCVLYGIGFLWLLYDIFKSKQLFSFQTVYALAGPVVMAVVFIYSRWINPAGGLYENRYFLVILPCVLLTTAYGVERLVTVFQGKVGKIISVVMLLYFTAACLLLGRRSLMDSRGQYARYSYAADYIISENELAKDDVLLICSSYDDVGQVVLEGWYDYYLLRRGFVAENFRMGKENSLDRLLADEKEYRKIYVVGDTDRITYEGDIYKIVLQDFFFKLTVLEKSDD